MLRGLLEAHVSVGSGALLFRVCDAGHARLSSYKLMQCRQSPQLMALPRYRGSNLRVMCSLMERRGRSAETAFVDEPVRITGAGAGPLKGLSFAVKDLYDVKGVVTGFGNPIWKSKHTPALETASAVQALLDAGGLLDGKTQMDEFAYSLNGENMWYGTPVNPACPDRIPGGSSSGSAVTVASGTRDFALGSDTAGSVRVPAAYCGTFGIRPTHGRVSLEGARPLAPSYDSGGWFAKDAMILRMVGDALLDKATKQDLTFRRWLVAKDGFDAADSATSQALYEVVSNNLQGVRDLLGSPEEIVVASLSSEDSLASWADVFRVNQGAEVWRTLGPWMQEWKPDCAPGIRDRLKMASEFTVVQVKETDKARQRVTQHMNELLGNDGVLMLPIAPRPAPLLGTADADPALRLKIISLTCIAGLAGLPQVNLPIAQVEGCPVGLGLLGPQGSDEALLQLAEKLAALLIPARKDDS